MKGLTFIPLDEKGHRDYRAMVQGTYVNTDQLTARVRELSDDMASLKRNVERTDDCLFRTRFLLTVFTALLLANTVLLAVILLR